MEGMILCLSCLVAGREGTSSPAVVILDGQSRCWEHARPMIKILSERTGNEPGDGAGQG